MLYFMSKIGKEALFRKSNLLITFVGGEEFLKRSILIKQNLKMIYILKLQSMISLDWFLTNQIFILDAILEQF